MLSGSDSVYLPTAEGDPEKERHEEKLVRHLPIGVDATSEMGCVLLPTPMRTTAFAPAQPPVPPRETPRPHPTDGFPADKDAPSRGCVPGRACAQDHPLSPQERRLEGDGTLRVVCATGWLNPASVPCVTYARAMARPLTPRRVRAILLWKGWSSSGTGSRWPSTLDGRSGIPGRRDASRLLAHVNCPLASSGHVQRGSSRVFCYPLSAQTGSWAHTLWHGCSTPAGALCSRARVAPSGERLRPFRLSITIGMVSRSLL
jgi:hypothetical protein